MSDAIDLQLSGMSQNFNFDNSINLNTEPFQGFNGNLGDFTAYAPPEFKLEDFKVAPDFVPTEPLGQISPAVSGLTNNDNMISNLLLSDGDNFNFGDFGNISQLNVGGEVNGPFKPIDAFKFPEKPFGPQPEPTMPPIRGLEDFLGTGFDPQNDNTVQPMGPGFEDGYVPSFPTPATPRVMPLYGDQLRMQAEDAINNANKDAIPLPTNIRDVADAGITGGSGINLTDPTLNLNASADGRVYLDKPKGAEVSQVPPIIDVSSPNVEYGPNPDPTYVPLTNYEKRVDEILSPLIEMYDKNGRTPAELPIDRNTVALAEPAVREGFDLKDPGTLSAGLGGAYTPKSQRTDVTSGTVETQPNPDLFKTDTKTFDFGTRNDPANGAFDFLKPLGLFDAIMPLGANGGTPNTVTTSIEQTNAPKSFFPTGDTGLSGRALSGGITPSEIQNGQNNAIKAQTKNNELLYQPLSQIGPGIINAQKNNAVLEARNDAAKTAGGQAQQLTDSGRLPEAANNEFQQRVSDFVGGNNTRIQGTNNAINAATDKANATGEQNKTLADANLYRSIFANANTGGNFFLDALKPSGVEIANFGTSNVKASIPNNFTNQPVIDQAKVAVNTPLGSISATNLTNPTFGASTAIKTDDGTFRPSISYDPRNNQFIPSFGFTNPAGSSADLSFTNDGKVGLRSSLNLGNDLNINFAAGSLPKSFIETNSNAANAGTGFSFGVGYKF